MKHKYIAKYEQSKWLVLSSLFFMIPALYAFFMNLYFYFILLSLTTIISCGYWIKATYSWRRNLDLVFAKISFTIFLLSGILYIKNPIYLVLFYSGLANIIHCFYLSNKLFDKKNKNWIKYHFLFHIIMTFEAIIILNSIKE